MILPTRGDRRKTATEAHQRIDSMSTQRGETTTTGTAIDKGPMRKKEKIRTDANVIPSEATIKNTGKRIRRQLKKKTLTMREGAR